MAWAESAQARQLSLSGWYKTPSRFGGVPTDILRTLGPPFRSHPSNTHHHDLRPYDKHLAPSGSMSATIGTDAQPMRTDGAFHHLPPRYIALQCIEPGEAYCQTHVWAVDTQKLLRESRATVTRPRWVSPGGVSRTFYSPILEIQSGKIRIRFDPLCMRPLRGTTDDLHEVRKTLEDCSQQFEVGWEPGDLLIIDNWRCLHGRGLGADQARSRRLRRWMIGTNDRSE
jgi:alpha-ketoglutarate-dependent taurine dioxygenase